MPLTASTYFSNKCVNPIYGVEAAHGLERQIRLPASVAYPQGTILGEITGTNEVQTLTIDATGGTYTLTYGGSTTGAIAEAATAAVVEAALVALPSLAGNAVQTITFAGSPTGGSFTISYNGRTSNPIAYNATGATVQTALENLETIGAGNVTVSGSAGGPYTVTFAGYLAGLAVLPLEVGLFQMLPTTVTATVAQTTLGGGGSNNVSVSGSAGGPYTITFQGVRGAANIAAITTDAALLTGGAGTAVITTATAGVAGTGVFKKQVSSATDGSQVSRAVLKYTCTTDSAGKITLGQQSTGGMFGEKHDSAPAWFRGDFSIADLVDPTDANLAQLGKIISGSIPAGGIVRIGV